MEPVVEALSALERHRSIRLRQVKQNPPHHAILLQPSTVAIPALTHLSQLSTAPAGTDRKEKGGGAWGENSRKTRHGKLVENADYRAWNDVEVFDVPSDLRRPGAEAVVEHVKFFGLEELFPSTGLQEKFNADAAFRTAIRRAIRDDLFVPDPNASDKVNAAISSLSSSLMVNWKSSRTGYASLTKVFADNAVQNLTGENFIQTLGKLCGPVSHGSLIDITSTGRKQERHSWHQDSGLDRFTVMVGFPPESNWTGVGVFRHSCKLSHPLRQDGDEGEVIQWEDYEAGELPVSAIGRPEYSPGREVMVYCDATHLHSAPDETNRESVWRFM